MTAAFTRAETARRATQTRRSRIDGNLVPVAALLTLAGALFAVGRLIRAVDDNLVEL